MVDFMIVCFMVNDLNGVSLVFAPLEQYYDECQEHEDVEDLVYYG